MREAKAFVVPSFSRWLSEGGSSSSDDYMLIDLQQQEATRGNCVLLRLGLLRAATAALILVTTLMTYNFQEL